MPTSSTASDTPILRGLESVERRLERIAHPDSGVHAVLLYGPRGSAKSVLARRLAQAWLCPNNTEGKACGECPVCASFAAGRAVDFQEIRPWGPGRLIKLDAIHRVKAPTPPPFEGVPVIEFFRARPLMAVRKVIHLMQIERTHHAAINALLKTLEEPPPHARLILETSDFGLILPTIRSRCVCLACGVPPLEEMAEHSWQSVFARTVGDLERMNEQADLFSRLFDTLEPLADQPLSAALKAAEDLRGIADALTKATGQPARDCHAEVIGCIAEWCLSRMPHRPQAAQAAAEAVRRIQGNASPPLVYDGMMISVLGSQMG